MSRLVVPVFVALVCASACNKQSAETTAPQSLASETISDDSGEMAVGIGYQPAGTGAIEFVVELKGKGTQEMDKVVVELEADGFDFVGGEMQWSGFVPPHTKHKHEVSLRAQDGFEEATVVVTVARSADSEVLLRHEVPFRVAAGNVSPL